MGYYDYLCALLAPMGVYELSRGSLGGAELYAAGALLDEAAQELGLAERESILATAEGEGLSKREKLFARFGASPTTQLRRSAIAALSAIGEDGFTPSALSAAIAGCGIAAAVEETDEYGKLRVRFPGTVGEPEEFARVRSVILDILPCHLAVEFYLDYLTWRQCEAAGHTWGTVEQAGHTWKSFEESFAEAVSA